jgi:hypothetical protein
MSELEFKEDEFKLLISELVPSYQQDQILSGLSLTEESDFDLLGLSLTGESQNSGIIVPTSAPIASSKSMWLAIKSEVYDYLCTTSRKYSKERKEAGVTIKNIITILATAIASSFSLAVGVLTGAVTLALLSALKIGKHAWCAINKPAV